MEQFQNISKESMDIKTKYKEVFDALETLPVIKERGNQDQREIAAMLYDLRPVAQMQIQIDSSEIQQTLEEKIEIFKKAGLSISIEDVSSNEETAKSIKFWVISISKDPKSTKEIEDLSKLEFKATPLTPELHRRFGRMMGYPDTAIDAYLNGTCLTDTEQEEKGFPPEISIGPSVVPFGISREHYREEAEYIKKYFRVLIESFPDNYGNNLSGEILEKYKEDVRRFLNKDFSISSI